MSSETDTSAASTASKDYQKRKSNKKHKRKSEKKHKKEKKQKRHKEKKRSRRDEPTKQEAVNVTPAQPNTPTSTEVAARAVDLDAFGPALPPHLLKSQPAAAPATIGPLLPGVLKNKITTELVNPNETVVAEGTHNIDAASSADEAEDGTYGPVPIASGADGKLKMSSTQIELEQRALEMKIAAIEGTSGQAVDAKSREEWMLELPEVGLKSGLAGLSNMKRTFHQGKERPDFSDRSAWTKTPQDALNAAPTTSKSTPVETLKRNAEAAYEQQRDEEQERLAKKHKKKHKRDESLLEQHQRKLRKEQKKKLKELAESGAKPERRPFTRDVDLKLNKIDKNQTKQIVDKAKILNTKFSSGHTKYL